MCPHVANNGLGQPLHRGGGDSETWFATHQFIAEMIFHARVKNHPCRTWEPNNADIFYVPFYGGLYASSVFREYNLTKRDELAVRLVDYMMVNDGGGEATVEIIYWHLGEQLGISCDLVTKQALTLVQTY
ncbi:hypothetical protein Bca52824_083747 [Brassica carinata]|uniref:Exostosin GT47 domain-containing protein n=1 Tax=Brassica carinata TaxID=52824 RepID=A0A8X7TVI4_BRACI|nr:hypothetical protein Bca52824_083747 [Brassica carinata]